MTKWGLESIESIEPVDGEVAVRGEDGEIGHRPVALAQIEPIAVRVVDGCGGQPEHAAVEHPHDVEGRCGG